MRKLASADITTLVGLVMMPQQRPKRQWRL